MNRTLDERLAARTLELVDIASQSNDEAHIAGHVYALLEEAGVTVRDGGDNCVIAGAAEPSGRPLVLLAGHFDTVPQQGNRPGHRDATSIYGLGASDMKGALAVMIELAIERSAAQDTPRLDVGYVFFGREELPFKDSALGPLLEREPGLRAADLAIVMEPTSNIVQAGCLGNLNATWTFRGRSGHSARPWLADNALHRAAKGVSALAEIAPIEHVSEGLTYTEVVSVTQLSGGIARNVIPESATAHVNYRYPPGMTSSDAERRLHELCDPHGELAIDGNAPSGPVPQGNVLATRLLSLSGAALEPKQAWTPVAEFALAGVDAVNFGPGDPSQAHARDEHVRVAALARSYEVLSALLGAAPS